MPVDAIDPGDAVNEEAGAERAEDEVFHAGFERADVAAHVGDEDVEGDGDEFERDEGSGEVLGGGEEHHAGAGEDGQGVEFAGAVFRTRMIGEAGEDFPVIDGKQDDEDRGDEGEDLVEAGEGIELIEIPQRPLMPSFGCRGFEHRPMSSSMADGVGPSMKQTEDDAEADGGGDADPCLALRGNEGFGHQQDEAEGDGECF